MQAESNTVEQPPRRAEAAPTALPRPALVLPPLLPPGGPAVVRGTLYLFCKRLLDVGLAGLLLVLTARARGVACLLVKLTSRGPVLYSQTRVGQGGRPF